MIIITFWGGKTLSLRARPFTDITLPPDPVRGAVTRPTVQSGSWGSNPRTGPPSPPQGLGNLHLTHQRRELTFTTTCWGGVAIKTPILQMGKLRLL